MLGSFTVSQLSFETFDVVHGSLSSLRIIAIIFLNITLPSSESYPTNMNTDWKLSENPKTEHDLDVLQPEDLWAPNIIQQPGT